MSGDAEIRDAETVLPDDDTPADREIDRLALEVDRLEERVGRLEEILIQRLSEAERA
jgi:hypothetical protein